MQKNNDGNREIGQRLVAAANELESFMKEYGSASMYFLQAAGQVISLGTIREKHGSGCGDIVTTYVLNGCGLQKVFVLKAVLGNGAASAVEWSVGIPVSVQEAVRAMKLGKDHIGNVRLWMEAQMRLLLEKPADG